MCPVVAAVPQPALLAISSTAGGCDEQGEVTKGQKMRHWHKNNTTCLVLMQTETEMFDLHFLMHQPACTEENHI